MFISLFIPTKFELIIIILKSIIIESKIFIHNTKKKSFIFLFQLAILYDFEILLKEYINYFLFDIYQLLSKNLLF